MNPADDPNDDPSAMIRSGRLGAIMADPWVQQATARWQGDWNGALLAGVAARLVDWLAHNQRGLAFFTIVSAWLFAWGAAWFEERTRRMLYVYRNGKHPEGSIKHHD